MGDLTKNFSLSEFAQRDPYRPVPQQYRANALRLARQLQSLRDVVGRIVITSSYRTLAHNTAIGGAANSQHLTAKAADFTVPGASNEKVYCAILALIPKDMEQGGLGWYGPLGHIHYDVRGFKRRWNKSGGALPVCPPVTEEEDEAMAVAFKVAGQGSTVRKCTGATILRYASLAELRLDQKKGIVPGGAVPTWSVAEYNATRKALRLD